FEADAHHFHGVLKRLCDTYSPSHYQRLKERCDEYFFLPHRNETRGIGGIFFDQLSLATPCGGDDSGLVGERGWERDFAFIAAGLEAITAAYLPLVERRHGTDYGARELSWQAHRRGRYVEFNLLYDRGTL